MALIAVWLPKGEKSLLICLAISVEYWRVTDRQTDRWTDILQQHSLRYAWHRHRAAKMEHTQHWQHVYGGTDWRHGQPLIFGHDLRRCRVQSYRCHQRREQRPPQCVGVHRADEETSSELRRTQPTTFLS